MDGAALDARRARVAESNRRFGAVLSTVGGVLAGFAFLILVVGGLVLTWAASAPASVTSDPLDTVRGAADVAMSAVPGVLALFGMCGLVGGEQIRRGRINRNATPPPGGMPRATFVSRFRVLPTRWHLVWVVVGLAVTFVLAGLPVISWLTGGWPGNLEDADSFAQYWLIYGSIAFGVTVAAIVSLVKKWAFRRATLRRGQSAHPAVGQRFWRWFDYRWRFDLWLAGTGGVLLILAFAPLQEAAQSGSDAGNARIAVTLFCVGVALIAAGTVCAINFWRAGEQLGSGESAS